ncbi:uncharacterized protein LOC130720037 [Lotus japonicus]|uniref:uncharacterized protein LOC130720037 n=1 Tax=Lotus japonicus TaxID=34305 RepID=UPI002583EBAA|nr:uncharacterized protein LOC130720037 [Lotus japonicus]
MVDGSYSAFSGCMGIGGLMRDSAGLSLGGFYVGSNEGDHLYAEMQALETEKRGAEFHCYSTLLMDILLLLFTNWDVKISHVLREGNAPANCLAGIGARLECAVMDLDSPLNEVVPLLEKDLAAL